MADRPIDRLPTAFQRIWRGREYDSVPTADESRNLDTAERTDTPTAVPYGARGRDGAGVPLVIPVGVPYAVAGEPKRQMLRKDQELPARPFEFTSYLSLLAAQSGELLNEGVGFPIRTVQIDNYSTVYLYVSAVERWIPPTTMGWQFPVARASTQIRVIGSAPPNFSQPAYTEGGVFSVFLFEASFPFGIGYRLA